MRSDGGLGITVRLLPAGGGTFLLRPYVPLLRTYDKCQKVLALGQAMIPQVRLEVIIYKLHVFYKVGKKREDFLEKTCYDVTVERRS